MTLPPEKKIKNDMIGDTGEAEGHTADKVIANILNFLPIQQVFLLMRVSSKWLSVAKSVISQREKIHFGNEPAEEPNEWTSHLTRVSALDTIATVNATREKGMWKSLMLMKSLRVISCGEFIPFGTGSPEGPGLRSLIKENSQTLEAVMLDPDSSDFPVSRFRAKISTTFPCLRILVCPKFYSTIVAASPRLESVSCYESSIAALDHLSVTRLESLVVDCVDLRTVTFQVSTLVDVVSPFRKLTKLHLHLVPTARSDCSPFVKIFNCFTRLEDVLLTLHVKTEMDAAICKLAIRNPLLRKVQLENMMLTNACLASLSRLKNLTHVHIASSTADFTEEGVLHMLRGGSRSSLIRLYLSCMSIFGSVILQHELEIMGREVERTIDWTFRQHRDLRLSDEESMSGVSSASSGIESK